MHSGNYHQTLTFLNACFSRFGRFFSLFSHISNKYINSFPLEYNVFLGVNEIPTPWKYTSEGQSKHIKHTYIHTEFNVHKGKLYRVSLTITKLFNENLIRKVDGNFIGPGRKGYNLMVPHNFIASVNCTKLFIRKSNCKRKSAYLGMSKLLPKFDSPIIFFQ